MFEEINFLVQINILLLIFMELYSACCIPELAQIPAEIYSVQISIVFTYHDVKRYVPS